MNQATLTACQGDGTFESKYGGLMYKYKVTVKNQDGQEITGTVNAKSDNPKWMSLVGTDAPVWYQQKGEYKGVPNFSLDTQNPAEMRTRTIGKSDDTTKRIENSWAIQTAIQCLGTIDDTGMSDDEYLKRVHTLSPRLKKLRDLLCQS